MSPLEAVSPARAVIVYTVGAGGRVWFLKDAHLKRAESILTFRTSFPIAFELDWRAKCASRGSSFNF